MVKFISLIPYISKSEGSNLNAISTHLAIAWGIIKCSVKLAVRKYLKTEINET